MNIFLARYVVNADNKLDEAVSELYQGAQHNPDLFATPGSNKVLKEIGDDCMKLKARLAELVATGEAPRKDPGPRLNDLIQQVEWVLNDLAYTAPEDNARRERAWEVLRIAVERAKDEGEDK